jgi:hypothetical protein
MLCFNGYNTAHTYVLYTVVVLYETFKFYRRDLFIIIIDIIAIIIIILNNIIIIK